MSEPDVSQPADVTSRGGPGWIVHALVVLASVIAIVASTNVWVERQLLDTDEWVETAEEFLANEEVRDAIAVFLVDQLYEAVDIGEELEARLPDSIDGLAGTLAAALRDPATQAVDRLLGSDRMAELWSSANESAHALLVDVLREEGSLTALSATDGAITLELGELVRQLGREVGLSDRVVDALPEDVGRITLLESEALDRAQFAVQVLEPLGAILLLVVIALYGGAIYLAGLHRRVAIREVGVALIASGAIVLVGRRLAVSVTQRSVADTGSGQAAAEVAASIGTDLLRDIAVGGMAYGAIVVGYASLVGPSAVAVRIRRLLTPVLVERPGVAWLGAGALFLFVLYLIPSEPFESWWRGLIFVGLFALALQALRQTLIADAASPEPEPEGEAAEVPPAIT
ncbi:MAG: hypothetical protein AB8G26_06155 [Ilumatobacter sp.]